MKGIYKTATPMMISKHMGRLILLFVFTTSLLSLRWYSLHEAGKYNWFAVSLLKALSDLEIKDALTITDWPDGLAGGSLRLNGIDPDELSAVSAQRYVALAFARRIICGLDCARAFLEEVSGSEEHHFASWLLGSVYYGEGDLAKAIATWNVLDQDSEVIFIQIGTRAYFAGQREEAVVFYEQAVRRIARFEPRHIQMLVALCIIHRESGNLAVALSWCRENVEVLESGSSWLLLGRVYYEMQEYEAAIESFRHSIYYSPDSAPAHRWLGDALLADKSPHLAQEAYITSLGLDPHYGWNTLGLARMTLSLGVTIQSAILFDQLRDHPDPHIRRIAEEELNKLMTKDSIEDNADD
jgi:tetratricopeptide (TPR) repeat protein